ncbi:MAG: tRNA threonylcarbamoyladenosine biosynthesis protein TsaE [Fluviibacter phosphoraccumulans EoVTN8]
MSVLRFELIDEQATLDLGATIARALPILPERFLITLNGDLGAGKTTLVRGVLRGLAYEGRVKSPTYPLLEVYKVPGFVINHFDLYRLETPEALIEAGFEENLSGPSISFVEWPDRAGSYLPEIDWKIVITDSPSGGRSVAIEAHLIKGEACLNRLA